MKGKRNLLLYLLLSIPVFFYAQEYPFVNIYPSEDYNAESQNWAINQSDNGYIYAANNLGLLEYNGAKWKLYPTPNQTIMRSVKVIDNRVYTGFFMDFGYWAKNKYGLLEYTSIVKKEKISVLDDEQFWDIIELDGWIIFQSLQRIYLYNISTKEVKIINSETKLTKVFKVKNTIYFQQLGKGIFKIESGEAKLYSNFPVLKDNIVVKIFNVENQLLFLTDTKGFFTLKNEKLIPWKNNANKIILGKTVYSAIQTKDESFVVGTISNGVVFLNSNGDLEYNISQKSGLSNNTVLSIFEDKNNTIWLGLDNGINSINPKSPLKIYTDKEGNLGAVYTSIVYEGNLYLGTNQGLFVKKNQSSDPFSFIKGTQGQVWCLVKINDYLFCGHDSGTFIIKNNIITDKIDVQGTWDIQKIDNNTLLQGNYTGLHILEKVTNKWRLKNKIKGFNNSSKSFALHKSNEVFVNHEYKGVFKLKLDNAFKNVINKEKDTSIEKGNHSYLLKYRNNIIYAYKDGIYKYIDTEKAFKKDSILSLLYTDSTFISGKLVYDAEVNYLWGFSKNNISYITPNTLSNKLALNKISVSKRIGDAVNGYENVSSISNKKFLFGVKDGYLTLNLNKENNNLDYIISLNTIEVNKLNHPKRNVVLNNSGVFNSDQNNISFNYSVPFLTKETSVSYQYILEGHTNKWSSWNINNSSISFKNLSPGEYVFKVRAKVGNKKTKNIEQYQFTIRKPWYISNLAIAIYTLSVLLFSLFMDRLYKGYYRKQRKRLLEKQEREFELKVLAGEKELIQVKNEQLRIDVESKNRELATSTMSVIKKNELLSNIKKELYKGGDNNIKTVINIIDKNLNNSDDWQVFKEAFNNVDKNFIKKLKSLHSSLTPNDLRLCAYLRLNLSSKEIAPLLNISPRSVEVKRYRLRKKMNLEHDINLTDYILSV